MATKNHGFDDEFLATMLGDFLDESQEYLSRLNENLLVLDELVDEGEPEFDPDMLNEMFRDAHSLKGLSGMLQLDDINRLTHRIENVFDAARNGQLDLTRQAVDLVFEALDKLTQMVDRLKDPSVEKVEYEAVVEGIRQLLEDAGNAPPCPCPNASKEEEALVESTEGTPIAAVSSEEGTSPDNPLEGVTDDTDIPDKYLSLFIAETEESLDGLSELLVGDEVSDLKPLLVICHRIKGAAASIGLHRCAALAHAMEDLLQQRHEASEPLTPDIVDAMLSAVDAIRDFIERLRADKPLEDRFPAAYTALQKATGAKEPTAQAATPAEPTATARARLTSEDRQAIYTARPAQRPALAGAVTFASDLPLAGMKASLVCNRLAGLGQLFAVAPSEEELPQLDDVPLLRFGLATDRGKEEVAAAMDVEGVVDIVLEELPEETTGEDIAPAAAKPAPPASSQRARDRRSSDRPAETVRVDIDRLDQLMNLTGQLVISKARFSQLCEQLKSMSSRKQSLHALSSLESRLEGVVDELDSTEETDLHVLRAHVGSMRRDFEAIRAEIEQLLKSRPVVNELSEAVHQLGRVTDGIQKSVMDTRMVPVGPLFSRFKRVIRDITRSNGKNIRLVIRGEKTELDKRMIDELSDPLIHLVRNAADHGIESPSDREAAGKPAQGTVTLDAFHRGNQIHIRVRDDGRGLDPERIRAKAVAKGILSAQDAQRLSDAQTFKLIWEPGFSTAEKITEVSGRGMGMDIVRSKIERINGSIELESEPGQGTTISIILPLTMAILPSLLTVIRDDVFAIPIEAIVEIVRASRRDLATVRGAKTARVRGRIIPIVELERIFQWHGPAAATAPPTDEWTLVIVGSGQNEIGLAVQDVLGEEDIVIKSLAENYRNVEGLAGASILGNGRVSLILDVPTLIDRASNGYGRPNDAGAPSASPADDVSAVDVPTA